MVAAAVESQGVELVGRVLDVAGVLDELVEDVVGGCGAGGCGQGAGDEGGGLIWVGEGVPLCEETFGGAKPQG